MKTWKGHKSVWNASNESLMLKFIVVNEKLNVLLLLWFFISSIHNMKLPPL